MSVVDVLVLVLVCIVVVTGNVTGDTAAGDIFCSAFTDDMDESEWRGDKGIVEMQMRLTCR